MDEYFKTALILDKTERIEDKIDEILKILKPENRKERMTKEEWEEMFK